MVDSTLIAKHWDGIGKRQRDLVNDFYSRLFERYPRYRTLFPQTLSHQMESMIDTLALIVKGAHLPDLFIPHVNRISDRHAEFGLTVDDFHHFIAVLLETLGDYNTAAWSPECEAAWGEALEQFILPQLTGRKA